LAPITIDPWWSVVSVVSLVTTKVPDVCAAATLAHPASERLTKTAEVAKSRRRSERRERDMT
jgi:hypothetical protein